MSDDTFDDEKLTTKEAARALGLSERTLENYRCWNKRNPAAKPKGPEYFYASERAPRYPKSAIDRIIQRNKGKFS